MIDMTRFKPYALGTVSVKEKHVTDNQTVAVSDAEDTNEDGVLFDDSRDWFLQEIVRLGSLGLKMGITVTTGGTVISGTLISGREYFEKMSAFVGAGGRSSDATGKEVVEIVAKDWLALTAVYDRPEDAPDDWRPQPAAYLHLDGAKIYTPGKPGMPNGGSIWRIRLNEISGFSLGLYQES